MLTDEQLGFRQLYNGSRSDYLRCSRVKSDAHVEWYEEAWQMREFCDEGYYEIGDDGRLYKLYRPDASFIKQDGKFIYSDDRDSLTPEQFAAVSHHHEIREDLNHNGTIEFSGNYRRIAGDTWYIDTYHAQFLNGQLVAIWKKGTFNGLMTHEQWEADQAHKRYKKERAAKLARMTPAEREVFLALEREDDRKRMQAIGGLFADALYAEANRKGFMRRFLEKV